MSWLTSFLNPGRGYDAAQGELNKGYNEGKSYTQPYYDALSDPQALQDKWSKGYQESEAAKQAQTMAQEHGLNAANSMGLMGSNTALNAIQSGTSQISNDYKQKYLDDLMNKYTAGVGVAKDMAGNANKYGETSAGLQFGKTNAPGEQFGKISGSVLKALMDYFTGGMGQGGMGRGAWSTGGG